MGNCLISQSGGPTSVINSSLTGVLEKNIQLKYFENVYCSINGIEGILNGKIANLSQLGIADILSLRYTPAAGLGSCRYKLGSPEANIDEYNNLFNIFEDLNIDTFFYIGGNDSMDTVDKLNKFAVKNAMKTKIIGIPKTIDNDICSTDHTPGYGSAAKMIATTIVETYLDSIVYKKNGVFIMETMGRDAGWLAASACLARLNGENVVDYIYLPEISFSIDKFLGDISDKLSKKNNVFVVVSEGLKDADGEFITKTACAAHLDKFGHSQLGGVSNCLKEIVLDSKITNKARAIELGTTQRCAMHCASNTDINEAASAGKYAYELSIQGLTGYVAGVRRLSSSPYQIEFFPLEASKAANHVKYFPKEWVNSSDNFVTEDAYNYSLPLIQGEPELTYLNGLPNYFKIDFNSLIIK